MCIRDSAYTKSSGKIAVLVSLDSELPADILKPVGHKIAMHIAAMRPLVLNIKDLEPAVLEKEKSIFSEQAKASGKPDTVVEKMVEGRVRKFYEEVVLNEQFSMFDGKMTISQFVEQAGKELGGKISIKSYKRFQIGETI